MISTQVESLQKLDRQKRYNMILDKLKECIDGMTARELSEALGFRERNATAPRLTELEKQGRVKTDGTKYDAITNRNVAVYVLNKEDTKGNNMQAIFEVTKNLASDLKSDARL